MAKKSFHISLSDAALAELERRAGGRDKRQAYIERWLTEPEQRQKQGESSEALGRGVLSNRGIETLPQVAFAKSVALAESIRRSWRSGPIPKPGQKGKK